MPKVVISQPKAIVLDYLSTAIKAGFIEKGLYAYVRKHGREVIAQKWADGNFKELVAKVRRQVRRDRRANEEIPVVPEKTAPSDEQQAALFNNILWYLDNKKETSAHYKLKFAMYEHGYENGKLVTHVYTDVARNLRKWKEMGILIYIYSNAWVHTQKIFMKKTNHGSLDDCIAGYFDTNDIGEPSQPESFVKLQERIGVPANEILYLTKGTTEGEAARAAGIAAILVISHTHQLKRYTQEQLANFLRLRSFDELAFGAEPMQGAAPMMEGEAAPMMEGEAAPMMEAPQEMAAEESPAESPPTEMNEGESPPEQ